MFDDMATYFIVTGQIMGGNGLYMIIVSREALGYRGHAEKSHMSFNAQNHVRGCVRQVCDIILFTAFFVKATF